jgi:hypothetical protein
MNQCQRCSSLRLARILAHCSDMCSVDLAGRHEYGYVPRDLGIGGGDDVQLTYCLDCGQIQGKFPLPPIQMEEARRASGRLTGGFR